MYLRFISPYLGTGILLVEMVSLFPATGTYLGITQALASIRPVSVKRVNHSESKNLPDVYNDESLKTYQDLLKVARDSNNRQLEGMALVAIGSIYLGLAEKVIKKPQND